MQIGSQYQREDLLNTAEFNMCEEVIATVFKARRQAPRALRDAEHTMPKSVTAGRCVVKEDVSLIKKAHDESTPAS